MKKLTIAATVAVMAVAAIAPAQDNSTTGMQNTTTVYSGPWRLRKSTGNKTEDRVTFIMDRTLNSVEAENLRSMFRNLPGGTAYVVMKAIAGAIDSTTKSYPTYNSWWSGDWSTDVGMSDINIYNAMTGSLDANDHGILGDWEANATESQLRDVAKLVRLGGQANTVWMSSGMNQ